MVNFISFIISTDDINDLLKFYRKYPTNDETNTASSSSLSSSSSTQTMMMDFAPSSSFSTISGSSSATGVASSSSFTSTVNSESYGTEVNNQNINILTTPINMGYVQNWHNSLNFTIMLTLRVKVSK